jgi:hypothetical protein
VSFPRASIAKISEGRVAGNDLRMAGVDRFAIRGLDASVHQLTFHPLRDTYCTWRAAY